MQDVLRIAYKADFKDTEGHWSREELRKTSSIGTRQAESAPRYAYGAGMLDEKNKLTAFGKQAYENDPMLEKLSTIWLIHYFLSAPNGFGPSYWHDIVVTRFRTSDMISKASLTEQIADHIKHTEERELAPRYAQSFANVFLRTYSEPDGLSSLGILREIENDKTYLVEEADPPPIWAFAVALLDFWQYQFPNRITVNLDELYVEGGLTSIFMIGEGRINRYLRTLQQEGIVDVFRVAPPYQVVLLNPDPTFALDKLYTSNDDE
ncbi:MAG: DUF4007 family protein [Anaerolineales bacterium]|nr:DUF4007 family protein [Anaerolineales bacterium]